jgi:flagellar biosynthesis/type III secretory pathway chaperone
MRERPKLAASATGRPGQGGGFGRGVETNLLEARMAIDWEAELAGLLQDLSAVQDDLLELLAQKRRWLAEADTERLSAMHGQETELLDRLQQCHQRRGELLAQAAQQGLPSDSLRSLATAVPRSERQPLDAQVRQSAARCRLLRDHSLTNWVLAQRTLIHLSQLLEIIGTGGRPSPTYSKRESCAASGVLVDRAA